MAPRYLDSPNYESQFIALNLWLAVHSKIPGPTWFSFVVIWLAIIIIKNYGSFQRNLAHYKS